MHLPQKTATADKIPQDVGDTHTLPGSAEETIKIEMPTQNYNDALTLAMDDLIANWQSYRRRYETWLRRK